MYPYLLSFRRRNVGCRSKIGISWIASNFSLPDKRVPYILLTVMKRTVSLTISKLFVAQRDDSPECLSISEY